MGFYISVFFINILIPLIITVSGYFMKKKPPGKINGVFGYRTTMSQKNSDTWEFSHKCCGRVWLKLGIVLLTVSVIVQLPFARSDESTVGIISGIIETIQTVSLVLSILHVEKELKRNFDKDGNRK